MKSQIIWCLQKKAREKKIKSKQSWNSNIPYTVSNALGFAFLFVLTYTKRLMLFEKQKKAKQSNSTKSNGQKTGKNTKKIIENNRIKKKAK